MRRAARTDSNQAVIIGALRACGASVQPLHSVGQGCPDLLVGFRGRNLLLEVKNGKRSPSARKLTADQTPWHAEWRGQVAVVENEAQAMAALLDAAPKSRMPEANGLSGGSGGHNAQTE